MGVSHAVSEIVFVYNISCEKDGQKQYFVNNVADSNINNVDQKVCKVNQLFQFKITDNFSMFC